MNLWIFGITEQGKKGDVGAHVLQLVKMGEDEEDGYAEIHIAVWGDISSI